MTKCNYGAIEKYGVPLEILCPEIVGEHNTKLAVELFRKRYFREEEG